MKYIQIRLKIKNPVRLILIWSVILAIVATIFVTILFLKYGFHDDVELQLKYFEIFGSAYKAIATGIIVAVLGAVIPQLLPEAKYTFEKYRDSRVAYSEAKTGILYLPYKLSNLSYDKAIALVQEVHEKLHLAESYDELREHLKPYNDPDTWGKNKFHELMAMKTVLSNHIQDWGDIKPEARLQELLTQIEANKARLKS